MSTLFFPRKDFLDAATIAQILDEMKRCHAAEAPVYGEAKRGGSVNPNVRKVSLVAVSMETRERVKALLMQEKDRLAQEFKVGLTYFEEPQFLRYETGGFFVAHQDGNTPMIYDHTRFRKVSVTISLSQQGDASASGTYGGGDLVLYGKFSEPGERVVQPPGTLIAFRSETTHEVLPITHGERYAIVSWFRSNDPQ